MTIRPAAPGDSPGAGAGFDEVYRGQYARLVRFAAAVTLSQAQAEEIVQDTFADAYLRWDTIERPEAWLRRVCANKAASAQRRQILERRTAERERRDEPATWMETSRLPVVEAMRALSPDQREVVFLHFYEDMSDGDIAAVLERPVGTVKSQLSRAKDILRKELAS